MTSRGGAPGQVLGGGVRKAYKSKGDDVTLSRFVKVPGSIRAHDKPRQAWLPGTRFEASVKGRTLFQKGIRQPLEGNVLVSGHNNAKIGRDVRKGKLFRGYWIYTLTLEERATCPRSCHHWDTCYGNNMPFAKRVDHTDDEALRVAIVSHLLELLNKRGRAGVLVRLHALGDFYSPEYVQFWSNLLDKLPNLAVFGYTAWKMHTDIGDAILKAKLRHGRRFAIRWSDGFGPSDCTVPISTQESCPPNAFVCPEQTGRTAACATCGACWETDKNVAFLEH